MMPQNKNVDAGMKVPRAPSVHGTNQRSQRSYFHDLKHNGLEEIDVTALLPAK
jgi:hypothetical protein